ncbi:hypothetical protein AGOR_G00129280 [Albula goreensis]|uniref:CEP63/Deup1 N-terminal domain-containing protein n=1 Tax=Albula goreensis TaxID=1534307 RepID=A0A8T3DDV3_9TELE|nr:hypothetical protein AGOR_G00129280 [Albula goreensis]
MGECRPATRERRCGLRWTGTAPRRAERWAGSCRQEFRIKSKEWERQRSLYLKDLAALEVNRRSLAAKYKLFQLTSGRYHSPQTGHWRVETQDDDITGLQTQLHAPSEAAQEDDVTARKATDGVGAMRTDQRPLLEANSLQQLQDELSRLGAELQASSDLLQATRLEEKRWKREAARLREQLTAQGTATRQECEIQRQAMAEEQRRLREQVGRVQGQLETSARREEQLREDIINLQNRLDSSRSNTAQLRDAWPRGRPSSEAWSMLGNRRIMKSSR